MTRIEELTESIARLRARLRTEYGTLEREAGRIASLQRKFQLEHRERERNYMAKKSSYDSGRTELSRLQIELNSLRQARSEPQADFTLLARVAYDQATANGRRPPSALYRIALRMPHRAVEENRQVKGEILYNRLLYIFSHGGKVIQIAPDSL